MSNRKPWGRLPAVDDVLDELRGDSENALRADWIGDVTIVRTPTLTDSQALGWQSTHTVEMESWHVTIPYESPFRPRTLRFTIVQCTEGGLGGGEGWAMCRRWVIRGSHLSPEELAVLGPLMVSGGIPELTFEGEL